MSKLRVCTARLDSTRREVVRLRVDECLHGRSIAVSHVGVCINCDVSLM